MGFRIHAPDVGTADPTVEHPGLAQFRFTPVETPSGFLEFSVQYLEDLPSRQAAVTASSPAAVAASVSVAATAAISTPASATPAPAVTIRSVSPGSSCGASPPDSGLRPRRPSWIPVPSKVAGPAAKDLDVEHAPLRSAQVAAPTSDSSSQSSGSYLGWSVDRFSPSPVFGYLGSGKPPLLGATAVLPAEAQRPRSGAITIGFAEGGSSGIYRASVARKVPLPVSGLSPQARDLAGVAWSSAAAALASGVSPSSNHSSGAGPMSCSPQLPFAFTPRNQLLDSDEGVSGGSPPITGRDLMALSVVKRSTWSPRSFLGSGSRQASPGLDAVPSLGTIPLAAQGVGLPDTAGWLRNSSKDSIDEFPFALECDLAASSRPLTSYAATGASPAGESRGERSGSDLAGAAIGNLVLLLQEAPPLQKTNYSKQASVPSTLLELKQVKESARQHSSTDIAAMAMSPVL